MTCDYCKGPVYSTVDMGTYLSRLCEHHHWKVADMEAEDEDLD